MNGRFKGKAKGGGRVCCAVELQRAASATHVVKAMGTGDLVLDELVELRNKRFVIALEAVLEIDPETACVPIRGSDQRPEAVGHQ
jgi:hypothetical protein